MSELERYLQELYAKAAGHGLNVRNPGKNWLSMTPIAPGCHVSTSVARTQIQVNLNLEYDEEREIFNQLYRHREAIERSIGEGLLWESKEGRKKTAVRATLTAGYADANWSEQHDWATSKMKTFEQVFGPRVSHA